MTLVLLLFSVWRAQSGDHLLTEQVVCVCIEEDVQAIKDCGAQEPPLCALEAAEESRLDGWLHKCHPSAALED